MKRFFKSKAVNEQVGHRRPLVAFIFFLLLFSQPGCQTIPTLPPVNLSEPGWVVRQGQAVWRTKRDASDVAGELILATNPDGRSFLQFTKTPLPFVVEQLTSNSWQIEIVPENRTISGRGAPPKQLRAWIYLPRCLAGSPPPKSWSWKQLENNGWRLENPATGESLEGFLNP
jgi:hypothetical protein